MSTRPRIPAWPPSARILWWTLSSSGGAPDFVSGLQLRLAQYAPDKRAQWRVLWQRAHYAHRLLTYFLFLFLTAVERNTGWRRFSTTYTFGWQQRMVPLYGRRAARCGGLPPDLSVYLKCRYCTPALLLHLLPSRTIHICMSPMQKWVTLMDAGSGEWKESVQLVFEYFCERTPRSFVEQRGTSLVWNYKYAGG